MAESTLIDEIRQCQRCAGSLPNAPRPVFQFAPDAQILITGQAPGRLAHERCRPFDDPSGARLRRWLGVDEAMFYRPGNFAILPMAFCFPGSGKTGDAPPPAICSRLWRERLLAVLANIKLTVLLGRYAINWQFPKDMKQPLIKMVMRDRGPVFCLPHPSPRNLNWLRQHPECEEKRIPALRSRVQQLLEIA